MTRDPHPSARLRALLAAPLALTALAGAAARADAPMGDPKRGEKVFATECAECHSVKEGKNKKGPSLFDVVGRPAASLADYDYSNAIKNSEIVWDEPTLTEYIAHPKVRVPGGKMRYDGLTNRQMVADLLAFLSLQK